MRAESNSVSARGADEWRRRPLLSRVLRLLIFGTPVALSFGAALLLSRTLPRATGPWTAALWIAIVAAASLLTLVVFERATRRLLPLAALLNVSLLFPDKAPARFAVARRTGSPQELRERLEASRTNGEVNRARQLTTIIELVLALSVHDRASRGHSERVRVFTDLLTAELKLPEPDRARLRWAALLHDIGKLEVPAALLRKPAKPTDAEWVVLHRHPEEGARLVAPLLPWLGEWGIAVEQHHERFDGTGYPHRLKGHDISLAARIVSVADTYEVMTAPRPYKRPMSTATARRELIRVSGTQLDPVLVRAFLNISVGRLWRTIGLTAWIAQIPTIGRVLSDVSGWAGAAAASVAAAGVVAVSGIIGAPPLGHANAGVVALPPPGVVLAGHPGSTPSPPANTGPGIDGSTTPSGSMPGSPSQTPAGSATAASSPAPSGHATPTASSTPTPTVAPTPTPTATPVPTPDPWSCATCLNTAPKCTSYCTNNKLDSCLTYCQGNKNKACTAHCFGDNNKSCLTYCAGPNNPQCQSNCRSAVTLSAAWLENPEPGRTASAEADTVSLAIPAVLVMIVTGILGLVRRGRRLDI